MTNRNSAGYFLVDSRPTAKYTNSHVATAWSLPPSAGEQASRDELLVSVCRLLGTVWDTNPPGVYQPPTQCRKIALTEMLSTMVVCGDEGCAHTAALVELLATLQPDEVTFPTETGRYFLRRAL